MRVNGPTTQPLPMVTCGADDGVGADDDVGRE